MEWSISKSKMFLKCQRKWYYYAIVASPRSSDPFRREAYQLKQLQTIHAWRGSIVDRVIQQFVVPRINRHIIPSEENTLNYAFQLMNKQIEFGKNKKHLLSETNKANSVSYCAFYELEYGTVLDEAKLQVAKEEVASSLKNLINSDFLATLASENLYCVAQRELSFTLDEDIKISCTPDLVVFFKDKPPLIVDWKVHVYGTTEAWLQLGIYAVALFNAKPHKDFPTEAFQIKSPSEINLVEFQLLRNFKREYSITTNEVVDLQDHAFEISSQMIRLTEGRKYPDLDPQVFQTARSPQYCEKCQFRKLCWKKIPVKKSCFQTNLGGFMA